MTSENEAGSDSRPERDRAILYDEAERKASALEEFLKKAKKETLHDWLPGLGTGRIAAGSHILLK